MTAGSNRPWSLRARMTRRMLILVIGGWLATIALSAAVLMHEMNEMFDEELQALAQTTLLFLDASGKAAIPQEIGVETNDGERVLRILDAVGPEPAAPWPALTEDGFADAAGWRILRLRADGAVIEVAQSYAWRQEETLETASSFLVLILPLIALVVWAIGHGLRRALAPVERLAGQMDLRPAEDLTPVVFADLPRELHPLVRGMNRFIGRIEQMRQAERLFVANAAHELRTPLAAIRARLNLVPGPDSAAAVSMIDALTRRVERLLQLSRSEAGLGLGTGPSDLLAVLLLVLEEVRRHSDTPIIFDDSDLDSLPVAQDRDALALLFRNALENALDHGTGTVRMRLTPEGVLTISNPAAGTAFLPAPFEKGPQSQGEGLGLSIMTTLARAMKIDMLTQMTDGQARLTLRFAPLPPPAAE